jgi:hypothetical protein
MNTLNKTSGLLCLLTMSSACSSPVSAPIHAVALCVEPAAAGTLACDPNARLESFTAWEQEATDLPGSSFALWAVSEDGAPGLVTRMVVPESWGGNVLRSKATLLSDARRAVTQPSLSSSLVASATVSESAPARVHLIDARGLSLLELPAAGATPIHAVLVCDRSDSTMEVSCDEDAITAAHEQFVARGAVIAGSTLSLWVPGQSREQGRAVLHFTAPAASLGERAAAAFGLRARLSHALSQPAPAAGSALVEALDVAAEELAGKMGKKLLFIASDMRQASRGGFNFERRAPTATRFIAWMREQALTVSLAGVEVHACGLHHGASGARGARFSAKLAERVRDAWLGAFSAMGAAQVTMLSTCGSSPNHGVSEGSEATLAKVRAR